MRLAQEEFRDESSGESDFDKDDKEELLPIDYAFMYKGPEPDISPQTIND